MKANYSIMKVLPVLFGFFIMGFVDVVGISTSYVKEDFGLSDTMANMLPMMVFLWFAVFSVPTGMLMNKIGRKYTVLLSMAITFLALMVPLATYSYFTMLVAFALLGIGNTILQVSLNPLVSNVVHPDKLTSNLTLGQFTKAVASFLGPIIAGFAALSLGNWKMLFPIFAGITILASLWLAFTPISREESSGSVTSFNSSFSLLKDKSILLLFLGIVFVVGVDVGMNVATPRFLVERTDMMLEKAGLGTSLYFAARTVGALFGAILLIRFSAMRFYKVSIILATLAMITMMVSSNVIVILTMVAVIGFSIANIFPIIFSAAIQKLPARANEISGLMIMGVAGGAVLPPVMGVFSDIIGQVGGMMVVLAGMLYLLFASIVIKIK